MFVEHVTRASEPGDTHRQHSGFTVLEALVTVAVISVIAGVILPSVYEEYEKARLAGCLAELDGMKTAVSVTGEDGYIPAPNEYWSLAFPSAEPGPYFFMVDSEGRNKGRGNDLDGCDEDDPGNTPPCQQADIKYVVLCAHDHGALGSYCFATDRNAPRIVNGADADPGYLQFAHQPNDDGTEKKGKTPRSKTHHLK